MSIMRRLDSAQQGFDAEFDALIASDAENDPDVEARARAIIADVRARGDAALVDYSRELDQRELASPDELEVTLERRAQARDAIDRSARDALEHAARRIRCYHERQRQVKGKEAGRPGFQCGSGASCTFAPPRR